MSVPTDFHGNELRPLGCFKRAVAAMVAMHADSPAGSYVIAMNELGRAFGLPTYSRTQAEKAKWDRIREAVWRWAYEQQKHVVAHN